MVGLRFLKIYAKGERNAKDENKSRCGEAIQT